LTNEQFDKLDKSAKEQVMASVKFAEKSAEPPLEDLYKYTYVGDGESGVAFEESSERTTVPARKTSARGTASSKNNGDSAEPVATRSRKKA
jgi:hypothetical protein